MNTKTKNYFIIKNTILLFVINLILGATSRIIDNVLDADNGIVSSIQVLINVSKVLLVILVVAGTLYILFLLFNYYSSKFYNDYRISAFEGLYHGFIDIYQIYDKIKSSQKSDDIQIDFKRSIIYFSTKTKRYSLIFLDLFGKIEGRIDSEFWAVLSKPKKEYGRKNYTKKDRFPNPYRTNANFIETLKLQNSKNYSNFVVISGFYNMKNKSDNIISPFEIVDILK